MEKKPRHLRKTNTSTPLNLEQQRELEAKKKLARPPKGKTEVTIGPSDRIGPDVTLQ